MKWWGELAKNGNLLKIDPDPATIQSGQTPIVLDWDYLNVVQTEKNKASFDWQVNVPSDGLFAQYYAQAVNTRGRISGWPARPAPSGWMQ